MKKLKFLLFLAFSISFINTVFAQKAEVGFSGGYGTTWLLNKNMFDRGSELDPVVSGAGNYGLAATFYFTEKVGLGIELNSATINQKYKGDIGGTSFTSKTKINFLDIPLLLKLKSGKSGFYFEIGPKLSYTLAASETVNSSLVYFSSTGGAVKGDFNNALISGVIGVGGRINVVDAVTISMGVRFAGTITDATKEYTISGAGTGGYDLGTAGLTANTNSSGDADYKRTTIASGGIQIGVAYRIGK
ncbi:MAG: PorT family protein [Bacteroidetes bacterium]|nr:PorT family protein [Bacteroidota bacterium]